MSYEYIIRLDEKAKMPSIEYMENIFKDIPEYFGQVQYPDDMAFEFRSPDNQDIKSMPDLYVICRSCNIIIASNNALVLRKVMALLVLDLVTELEYIKVLQG